MISPEVLRRYPFFGFLSAAQLKEIAMLTNEFSFQKNEVIFNNDEAADALYFLADGNVDLWYIVVDKHEPDLIKEFQIGEINPGEAFGISALVEPYVFTTRAVSTSESKVLKVDITQLKELFKTDSALAYEFMSAIAKTTLERLQNTRVQLAAART